MTRVLTAVSLILTIGTALAAEKMSAEDRKIIDSCVAMTDDFMTKDKACTEAMKRTHIAQADMAAIRACRALTDEAMDRDKRCTAMREKYPDVMISTTGTERPRPVNASK